MDTLTLDLQSLELTDEQFYQLFLLHDAKVISVFSNTRIYQSQKKK